MQILLIDVLCVTSLRNQVEYLLKFVNDVHIVKRVNHFYFFFFFPSAKSNFQKEVIGNNGGNHSFGKPMRKINKRKGKIWSNNEAELGKGTNVKTIPLP